MLTRKRIIAVMAGALALSAAAGGAAWATISPKDDYYENDHSFNDNKHPYKVVLDGNRLVIRFAPSLSNDSPFNNDGTGFERLIGVTSSKGKHGLRYSVKFGRGPDHEARLVIHFVKNFTTKFNGRANLRYFVQTSRGIKSARLLFDIGGLCGKVSCS